MDSKSWYWVPHSTEGFLPGMVKSQTDGKSLVVTESGEELSVKTNELLLASSLEPVENLVSLSDLSEPALLHTLRQRFAQDNIYTYISSILISVNPFKQLPIYSSAVMQQYRSAQENLPPHVYALARDAFEALTSGTADRGDGSRVAVIISGESGAGKSEATKLVLQYLAEAGSSSSVETQATDIASAILQTSPLLEAFGNAKTQRNDNSSRFGKLIQVHFDDRHRIVGASIQAYLLEKSRVFFQSSGERNYHVFYQLLAGATPAERTELCLGDASDYAILAGGVAEIAGVDDAEEWRLTLSSMSVLGVSHAEQAQVKRVLAGLLHLGNVAFAAPSGEEAQVAAGDSLSSLERACELLGVPRALLEQALLSQYKQMGRDRVLTRKTVPQAQAGLHALIKHVYSSLFEWVIRTINQALAPAVPARHDVNILDIFGFEHFEVNSFEQLCINYANEKMQTHFNECVFRLEVEEYKRERLDLATHELNYVDNSLCVALLDGRDGILTQCDTQLRLPTSTDDTLLQSLHAAHERHPHYVKPRLLGPQFTVKHYAGAITYDVTSMLVKNKDALDADLLAAVSASSVPLLAGAVKPTEGTAATIAGKFKQQLQSLMDVLYACQPFFIRCVKSNSLRRPALLQGDMVLEQIRCLGLRDAVKMRQVGYPVRLPFADFVRRYRTLAPALPAGERDAVTAIMAAATAAAPGAVQYKCGATKVFYRVETQTLLEHQRQAAAQRVLDHVLARAATQLARQRAQQRRTAVAAVEAVCGWTAAGDYLRVGEASEAIAQAKRAGVVPGKGPAGQVLLRAEAVVRSLQQRHDAASALSAAAREQVEEPLLMALQGAMAVFGASGPLRADAVAVPAFAEAYRAWERVSSLREQSDKAVATGDGALATELLRQWRLLPPAASARAVPTLEGVIAAARERAREEELQKQVAAAQAQAKAQEPDVRTRTISHFDDVADLPPPPPPPAVAAMNDELSKLRLQKEKARGAFRQSIARASMCAAPPPELTRGGRGAAPPPANTGKAGGLGVPPPPPLAPIEEMLVETCEEWEEPSVWDGCDEAQLVEALALALAAEQREEAAVITSKLHRVRGRNACLTALTHAVAKGDAWLLQSAVASAISVGLTHHALYRQAQALLDAQAPPPPPPATPVAASDAVPPPPPEVDVAAKPVCSLSDGDILQRVRALCARETYRDAQYDVEAFAFLSSGLRDVSAALRHGTHKQLPLTELGQYSPASLDYSLTGAAPSSRDSKHASALFSSLLGCAGDKRIAYPDAAAAEVILTCARFPQFRDEVYLQLCAQTAYTPTGAALVSYWRLIALFSLFFPPSLSLLPHLMHHLYRHTVVGKEDPDFTVKPAFRPELALTPTQESTIAAAAAFALRTLPLTVTTTFVLARHLALQAQAPAPIAAPLPVVALGARAHPQAPLACPAAPPSPPTPPLTPRNSLCGDLGSPSPSTPGRGAPYPPPPPPPPPPMSVGPASPRRPTLPPPPPAPPSLALSSPPPPPAPPSRDHAPSLGPPPPPVTRSNAVAPSPASSHAFHKPVFSANTNTDAPPPPPSTAPPAFIPTAAPAFVPAPPPPPSSVPAPPPAPAPARAPVPPPTPAPAPARAFAPTPAPAAASPSASSCSLSTLTTLPSIPFSSSSSFKASPSPRASTLLFLCDCELQRALDIDTAIAHAQTVSQSLTAGAANNGVAAVSPLHFHWPQDHTALHPPAPTDGDSGSFTCASHGTAPLSVLDPVCLLLALQGGVAGMLRNTARGDIIHNPARIATLVVYIQRFKHMALAATLLRVHLPDTTPVIVRAEPWQSVADLVRAVAVRIGQTDTRGWWLCEVDSAPALQGPSSAAAGSSAPTYHALDTVADLGHRWRLREQARRGQRKRGLARLFSREATAAQHVVLTAPGGLVIDTSGQMKVVFRKRFFPNPVIPSADPVANKLLAHQMRVEVDEGWHHVSFESAAALGAIATTLCRAHTLTHTDTLALPRADTSLGSARVTLADGDAFVEDARLLAAAEAAGVPMRAFVWRTPLAATGKDGKPLSPATESTSSQDVPAATLYGALPQLQAWAPTLPRALATSNSSSAFAEAVRASLTQFAGLDELAAVDLYLATVLQVATVGCSWLLGHMPPQGQVWLGVNQVGVWLLNADHVPTEAHSLLNVAGWSFSGALLLHVRTSQPDVEGKTSKVLRVGMAEEEGAEACTVLMEYAQALVQTVRKQQTATT